MQLKSLLIGTFLLATSIITKGQGQGSIDYTFNSIDQYSASGANNQVRAMAVQPDGKIIIAGNFTNYNGTAINRVVRINTDGSIDLSFNIGSGANAIVHAAVVQSDGKILIAGNFTTFNGTTVNRLVRLNPNGTIDSQFAVGTGVNRVIHAIEMQPDGKFLIGGNFTSYNGTSINRIARINNNGSIDASFTVGRGANSAIRTIKVLADGKILIAGAFTSYNRTTRNRLARLNSNGTLDTGFTPSSGANNTIYSVEVQTNGTILIGGDFTSFNGTTRNRIARVNTNGTLDTGFNPGTGANSSVNSIVTNSEGLIVMGGAFTTLNGTARNYIGALNANGSLNSTFNPTNGASALINRIIVSGNKLIIGGTFTSYNGILRNRITRTLANGNIDISFNASTGANDVVNSIAIQSNGKVIAVGNFTTYNDTIVNRIVRLNQNGSIDATFISGLGANGQINSVAIQNDGKIIIGGDFTSYNGVRINRIARLNANGTLDVTFNVGSGTNGTVNSIVYQTDGKVIIAGAFTTYAGSTRNRIARLNTNGSYDSGFNIGSGSNNTILSASIQTDGRIIIGGTFSSYNGTSRIRIARLNINGSIDATFNPGTGANNTITAVTVQTDGKILIGGLFTSYNGTNLNRITRLNPDGSRDNSFNIGSGANGSINTIATQPDNNILIGGDFTTYNGVSISRFARIKPNGTIDTNIAVGAGANSTVKTIALQSDSKILVGGNFTAFNGIKRTRIARLFNCYISSSLITQTACNDFTLNGINYTESGTYIQTLTNAAGCDSIISLNLTIVEIAATVWGSNSVCEGDTIKLETGLESEYTYNWSGPNGFSSAIHNPIIPNVTLSNEGTYTLIVSSPNGCQLQLSTIVKVDALPTLEIRSNSPVCSGSTLSIMAQGTGNFYSWNGPNNFSSNNEIIRIPNVSPSFSGTYTATSFSQSGCSISNSIEIEISGSYIDESADDYTFNQITGPNNWVNSSLVLPGDRIALGGHFIGYNRLPYNRIAIIEPNGMLDPDFNPCTGANRSIYAMAKQQDEKLIVAGDLTHYGSNLVNGIARLNTDGSIDLSFNTGLGFDSRIYALALQPDGKVIVGGAFVLFNGETKNRIVRLNPNGTLDETFNIGSGANGNIFVILVQPDGKILLGGNFTRYNGAVVKNIIRLNADGTLDNQFNLGLGPNGNVRAMLLLPNNQILIAGRYSEFNGIISNGISRLNTDGSLDQTFSTGLGPNNVVYTMGLQSNGKIIIGGNFTSYNGISNANRIARLNSDGSFDETFVTGTGANNYIYHLNVLSDDRILISGPFITFNQIPKRFLAFLEANGSLSESYVPTGNGGANSTIFSIKMQSDSTPLIAGFFTAYNGTSINRIARLKTNGHLDENFNPAPGANGPLRALEVLPNGKVLTGGFFTLFNENPFNRLVQLNSNGSLDPDFQIGAGFNGPVYTIKAQPDGRMLVGGSFSLFNGISRRGLVKLNNNGTLDATFTTGTGSNGIVWSIANLSNGKVLIGGTFTTFNSIPAGRIVQLNSNGSVDNQFNSNIGANGTILAIAIQPDGKIIAAGQFTQYNQQDAYRIVRLNPDGSIDPSFLTGLGANHNINAVALQNDGKIIIGGDFTSFNGVSINRIARLNSNGTLDETFNSNRSGANKTVWTLALTPDNSELYIAGMFNYFNGVSRARIARIRLSSTPKTIEVNETACNCFTLNNQTLTESGKYTYQFTDSFGDENTVHVNLNVVKPNANAFQIGQSLIAEANNANYQWYYADTNEPVANANTQIFKPSQSGYYSLWVKEGDCAAKSEAIWFQKDFNANIGLAIASAYPNPTPGKFTLSLGNAFHSVKVIITDAMGRTVYTGLFANAYSAYFDLSNQASGIYMVHITADGEKRTLKVVKQ